MDLRGQAEDVSTGFVFADVERVKRHVEPLREHEKAIEQFLSVFAQHPFIGFFSSDEVPDMDERVAARQSGEGFGKKKGTLRCFVRSFYEHKRYRVDWVLFRERSKIPRFININVQLFIASHGKEMPT